jgi:RNA polymerase sigma-70 factor (ECF subfamily)
MPQALIQASYAQALSRVISICADVNVAEDCLQDAVEQALKHWPSNQPKNPAGWLVSVARNKFIDYCRRHKKQINIDTLDEALINPDLSEQALLSSYNDDLLRLIFTCNHPALALETQVALTLKHVLGLSVEQIAGALLVNVKSMERRLTRAKKKIAAAKIQYQIPDPQQWQPRLAGVLKTIYLLFNEGYLVTHGPDAQAPDLCHEAIRLGRLLHSCIREDAQIIGLLALMLHQNARATARTKQNGEVILLADQDRSLWKRKDIAQANVLVEKALRLGGASPYAIQAAIAALYNNAANDGDTDWLQISGLYQILTTIDPNPVIKLNAAVITARLKGHQTAIEQILALEPQLQGYRHYYNALAGLYFEAKQYNLAKQYYLQTLEHTQNDAQIKFINARLSLCIE